MNKDKTGNERYRRWYAAHLLEVRETRTKAYRIRLDSGLCPRCGCAPEKGLTLCGVCLEKSRGWNKNSRVAG